MSAITIDKLSKHFKVFHLKPKSLKEAFIQRVWNRQLEKSEFWALKDIQMQFEEGQAIGIIGTNGSGKSTLLKIIAGIFTPTTGSIQVNGQVAALLELGAGFHPDFTGRENILVNGVMLGFTRKQINQRMDEIIAFAELEDFIDNPVKTYSSGMYMRLGFSVAVNVNPDILLVDEVLAVGDYSFQKKCLQKMEEFKRNKKTIVFVSHDLVTVEQFCHQAGWLHNGKLMDFGPAKKVLNEYMNRINEERKLSAEKEQLRTGGGIAQSNDSNRWGSREVEITGFKLLDKNRKEKYLFESGDAVTLQIDFLAREEITNPVFALGIYTSDGIRCYGTNTGLEHIQFEPLSQGPGRMKIDIERLDLLEGKYLIDLAIQTPSGQYFDFLYRLYSFTVTSPLKDVGIYRMPHQWKIEK